MSLLEARNLSKVFGGLRAVSDVSFEVNAGEIFGMIGPNGAGKTTTFNLIAGTFQPTSGDVFFQGERVTGLETHEIAHRGIIRTFQNIRLFRELSVAENVFAGGVSFFRSSLLAGLVGSALARREQEELRDRVAEILDFMGIQFVARTPAGELPHGHQRRVEIARALAARPKLLLLDEPTAGMNPHESAEVMGLIRNLQQKGITVLLIEHDMSVVMGVCDRIVVLTYGEKIAEGAPQEIQRNPLVIEAYLGSGHTYA